MKFISNYFVRFSIMAGLYQYNGLPKGKNAFTGENPWLATAPTSLEQMRIYAQGKNTGPPGTEFPRSRRGHEIYFKLFCKVFDNGGFISV